MKREILVSFLFLIVLSFLNFSGAITSLDEVCPEGLVAYYPDGDGSDASGSGNAMYPFLGTSVSSEGKIGDALEFDGGSFAYAQLPLDIFDRDKFTFGVWIKTSRARAGILCVSQGLSSIYEFNPLTGLNSMNIQQRAVMSYLGGTSDGEWHYVAITFDSIAGKSEVYLDGELVSDVTTYKRKLVSGLSLLGQYVCTTKGAVVNVNPRYAFLGLMDEIAIFDRVLSKDEIVRYYNNGNGRALCGNVINPPVSVCEEEWNCGSWGDCINGEQTRTCSDANNCGTSEDKPVLTQACSVEVCIESWNCDSWGDCINGEQTRTCSDANNCGTSENKPVSTQSCAIPICTESWNCGSWGDCINGEQTRTCSDANNCGTTESKPVLMQLCSSNITEVVCKDSDGGENYYVKGVLSINDDKDQCAVGDNEGTTAIDSCSGEGCYLWEFYCASSQTNASSSEVVECPNGCEDGACIKVEPEYIDCDSLVEKVKNPKPFFDQYGSEYRVNYNDSYNNSYWYNGKETLNMIYSAGWSSSAYGNYYYPSYSVNIFESEEIASSYIERFNNNNWDLCSAREIIDSSGKKQVIYECSYYYRSREDDNNVRVIWRNENKVIIFYSGVGSHLESEDVIRESQRNIEEFINRLENNYYEHAQGYLPWNFEKIVSFDLGYCGSDLVASIDPETNETCSSCWSCAVEPVICPEHGYQTRTCIDHCCDEEEKVTQLSCNPGICSGCLVPKWIGSNDNKCIPYGFRFAQQESDPDEGNKLYAGESEGVNLSILSESEVSLSFFGKGGQEYSYNLGLNEQTWIYVPSFEESISSFRITITEINSEDGYIVFDSEVVRDFNAYCDIDGWVKQQKTKLPDGEWVSCQNNYECYSNLCSGGSCVEINDIISEVKGFKGIGTKIFCRIASIFGVKDYNSCLVDYLGDDYISSESSD